MPDIQEAKTLLEQGKISEAEALALSRRTKDLRDPAVHLAWAEILEELGEHDKAREVWRQGQAATGSDIFAALLRDLDSRESAPRDLADQEREEKLVPSQAHLVSFTTLFSGREGVYARQWVSPSGESGYTPVQEPFTLKVAENHILGNYTVGLYPVRLDNTVTFIAFDFDLAKFVVRQAISSQRAWESAMHKVHQSATRLLDLAANHDLPLYLEDSGFKGRHAWIFLETPIPAGVTKKCGDLLVRLLQPLPPEVMVEVFPKQGAVKKGGLGNLIKLPLGIHKRTGKRALFLEPDGQPVAEQLKHLETLRKAPPPLDLRPDSAPAGPAAPRSRPRPPGSRSGQRPPALGGKARRPPVPVSPVPLPGAQGHR